MHAGSVVMVLGQVAVLLEELLLLDELVDEVLEVPKFDVEDTLLLVLLGETEVLDASVDDESRGAEAKVLVAMLELAEAELIEVSEVGLVTIFGLALDVVIEDTLAVRIVLEFPPARVGVTTTAVGVVAEMVTKAY